MLKVRRRFLVIIRLAPRALADEHYVSLTTILLNRRFSQVVNCHRVLGFRSRSAA
jgi:hypothetical protein